nr:hypothetical protein [Tanacetum cinerariifolium]
VGSAEQRADRRTRDADVVIAGGDLIQRRGLRRNRTGDVREARYEGAARRVQVRGQAGQIEGEIACRCRRDRDLRSLDHVRAE